MADIDKTIIIENPGAPQDRSDLLSEYMASLAGDGNTPAGERLMTFEAGSIIGGKYRILSVLQSGSTNSVFIVHPLNNMSERCVAKIMPNNVRTSSAKRFLREAKLHSNINHNNIVKMLDYWSDDHAHYIILEYINGKSLKACCNEFSFDENAAAAVAMEIASALRYVWDNFKLVHRDIKPENIMLDNEGYIKLLDFGISKSQNVSQESYLTMENTILGTPGYMSPEQYINSKDVSVQSDMFSLGATLYYLLTDDIPFNGNDIAELYKNTCNTPPDIRNNCPGLSEVFIAFLEKMMQKDPNNRPANWNEVINELVKLM